MAEENGNGYGKMILIGSFLLAIITAFIRPINQQIETLAKEQEKTEQIGTRYSSKELAAVEIKFAEIETQFRNLNERTSRMESSFNEKMKDLDEKFQLEMRFYNKRRE